MLSSLSAVSCLSFNPSKSVHISFSSKPPTSYILSNECPINSPSSHKDLGVIVSSDLQWHQHHDHILGKAYKTLGIIRRTFSHSNSATTKLNISLIKSQLTYCSIIWRPHLIQDRSKLEQIQQRATKYILNDYSSTSKSVTLNIRFEISDSYHVLN